MRQPIATNSNEDTMYEHQKKFYANNMITDLPVSLPHFQSHTSSLYEHVTLADFILEVRRVQDNTPLGIQKAVVSSNKTIRTGQWGYVSFGKWVKTGEVIAFRGSLAAVRFYFYDLDYGHTHIQDLWVPTFLVALPPSTFWPSIWARIRYPRFRPIPLFV